MSGDLAGELLAAALRLAVPVLLAALGEIVVERAGLINVGVEGMMLAGCFAAAVVALATGSADAGALAGAAAGLALAGILAALVVRLEGDPVVSGTGINLLALALTGFLYEARFGRTGAALAPPRLETLDLPGVAALPPALRQPFAQAWTGLLAVALGPVLAWMLARTGLGLRLRAAGEEPRAAAAAGASVAALCGGALLFGGALAGLAGAALALGHAGTFVPGMTAGRGFLALALVICARQRPGLALPVGLLFGAAAALPHELQALGSTLPYQLARMAPYLLALFVLAAARRQPVRS